MTPSPTTTATTDLPWHKVVLLASNLLLMICWYRVLWVVVFRWSDVLLLTSSSTSSSCSEQLSPVLRQALGISFVVEVLQSLFRITSSNTVQVLLFATVRWGVESLLVTSSRVPCHAWQHIFTVLIWSVGEVVRFTCCLVMVISAFLVVEKSSITSGDSRITTPFAESATTWAKRIRYSVGPVLFPLGALGEMLMVVRVATQPGERSIWSRLLFLGIAGLWPLGFYPLMKQLLRQRRKFFQSIDMATSSKSSTTAATTTTQSPRIGSGAKVKIIKSV